MDNRSLAKLVNGNHTDSRDSVSVESDRAESMAMEMLGDCQAFVEADGPNGPWHIESLTVTRNQNTLNIYDVDGMLWEQIAVGDLVDESIQDDPKEALLFRIALENKKTLDAL